MSLDLGQFASDAAVADGGWSTVLRARGWPPEQMAELANLQQPGLVAALARDYLAAGAQFVSTNTFAANRVTLEHRGLSVDPLELNRRGAAIARQAVDSCSSRAYVAGVIGPSGMILAVREADEERLEADFAAQARALAEGGADLLVLETFSELRELLLALRAVRSVGLPVVASMSFDSGPQRTQTVMGVQADEFAQAADEAGADAIGCNCCGGIATVLPAVIALRANTRRPLWVKPSAGLPDLIDGRPEYPQTPEDFGTHVSALLDAGVDILGGCCGVRPEHIRRVAALVASRRQRRLAKRQPGA